MVYVSASETECQGFDLRWRQIPFSALMFAVTDRSLETETDVKIKLFLMVIISVTVTVKCCMAVQFQSC